MQKLSLRSIGDVLAEIDSAFARKAITNNYLLKSDYENLLKSRALHLFKEGENLFLMLNRNGFGRLYYHLVDLDVKTDWDFITDPIVTEVLFRGNRQPEKEISYLQDVGFKLYLKREHLFLKSDKLPLKFIESTPPFTITIATYEEDVVFAKKLIDEYLDLFTGDNLTLDELRQFANSKDLFIIYVEGKRAGILQAELKKGIYWLGHVVVHEDFRGKGLGRYLTEHYLKQGIEKEARQFQLWVLTDNFAANKMYASYGFRSMGRFTQSLLKD